MGRAIRFFVEKKGGWGVLVGSLSAQVQVWLWFLFHEPDKKTVTVVYRNELQLLRIKLTEHVSLSNFGNSFLSRSFPVLRGDLWWFRVTRPSCAIQVALYAEKAFYSRLVFALPFASSLPTFARAQPGADGLCANEWVLICHPLFLLKGMGWIVFASKQVHV